MQPRTNPPSLARQFARGLLLAVLAACGATSLAQSPQRNGDVAQTRWTRGEWDGMQRFEPVYCLRHPQASRALAMEQARYNGQAIHFTRVLYPDNLAVMVVASTLPAGREPRAEYERLAAETRRAIAPMADQASVAELQSALGPVLETRLRNAVDAADGTPFPLRRALVRSDGSLFTWGITRLWVRGADRIELALLQRFEEPLQPREEAQRIAQIVARADALQEALVACTATLPPRRAAP